MATIAKVPRVSGHAWKAIIKHRGRVLKSKTFKQKSVARAWARQEEAAIQAQRAWQDPAFRITLQRLADAYLANYQGRDHHRRSQTAFWCHRLGARKLADISHLDIRRVLDDYASGKDRACGSCRAPASVNRLKAALSAIFQFGLKQGLASSNPARLVPAEPENNAVTRFLDADERQRLLEAWRRSRWDRLYLLVLMAMQTGARKGELLNLRWEEIDFERRQVTLRRTKNGSPRVLCFPDSLVDELRIHRCHAGLVFSGETDSNVARDFRKVWIAALDEARISDFRFHDLRHTAASYLAMGGASLIEIADVLGHRSLQTTKRYAHLNVSHKRALIERCLGDLTERP